MVWEERDRDDSDLARGLRLESALELVAIDPDALDPLEREFVAASDRLRTAEADAQKERAERDRRSNRHLRGLLAGVGLLLVVALIAGFFAVGQRNDARAANTDAELARLVSDSAAATADDPELAILLALEAHRRAPGPVTEQAVLNALGRSEIVSRAATFEPIDPPDGCPVPQQFDHDYFTERFIADGRLLSRDLTSGEITDHGSVPGDCGVWMADPITGNAQVTIGNSGIAERWWLGTIDDPTATEITDRYDGPPFPFDIAGDRFVATEDGTRWSIHDAATGEQVGSSVEVDLVYDVFMHPTGEYVAILGQSLDGDGEGIGRLHLVDARTGTELDTISAERSIGGVAFDTEANEMLVAVEGEALKTYDLPSGDLVHETPLPGTSEVRSVGVRPDGAVVVASLGQIEVLDRRTGPIRQPVELRDAALTRVRPDGTVLVIRSDDRLEVVDVGSRTLIERGWPIADQAQVSINAGQAGVYDAFGLGNPEVVDLHTGERSDVEVDADRSDVPIVWVYPEDPGSWTIYADGTMVLRQDDEVVDRLDVGTPINTGTRIGDLLGLVSSRDGDAVVSLVDLAPGERRVVFEVPVTDISTVIPSLEGGLHTLAFDGTLTTYDSTGQFVSEFDTGAEEVRVLTLDPESERLAVGTSGGVVLIDTNSGETEQLQGGEQVTNLGFARDGSMLVITAADGTVRLWDLERSAPAGLVWDGTGSVLSSPSWYDPEADSVWVATSGLLMEVPLDPQRWVEQACDLVGRNLTEKEWERWIPGDDAPRSACGSTGGSGAATRADCFAHPPQSSDASRPAFRTRSPSPDCHTPAERRGRQGVLGDRCGRSLGTSSGWAGMGSACAPDNRCAESPSDPSWIRHSAHRNQRIIRTR